MKKIIALILAALMLCAALVGCGDSKKADASRVVKTTVSKEYDDGYAKKFVEEDKISTDESGKTTYEFTGEQYEEYVEDHAKAVGNEITSDVAKEQGDDFGQYAFIKTSEKSVIIGVNPGKYEAAKAEACAPTYAKNAFKVFQGLEEPVSTIKVIFCNANNQQEVYGSFEVTAE